MDFKQLTAALGAAQLDQAMMLSKVIGEGSADGLDLIGGAERFWLQPGMAIPDHSTSESLYLVIDGVLILQSLLSDGRRQVLGFGYPDDVLCSAYNRHLPSTSAYAAKPTALWRLPHSSLKRLTVEQPGLTTALISMAAAQMERALVHTMVLGRLRVEERLVAFLLEIALRSGRSCEGGMEFELPMTRDDIADYLGLSSESVSRGFTKLRQAGVAQLPKPGKVQIDSLEALSSRSVLAGALIHRFGRHPHTLGTEWGLDRETGDAAAACPFHGE